MRSVLLYFGAMLFFLAASWYFVPTNNPRLIVPMVIGLMITIWMLTFSVVTWLKSLR